jgi:hypothetical protein
MSGGGGGELDQREVGIEGPSVAVTSYSDLHQLLTGLVGVAQTPIDISSLPTGALAKHRGSRTRLTYSRDELNHSTSDGDSTNDDDDEEDDDFEPDNTAVPPALVRKAFAQGTMRNSMHM